MENQDMIRCFIKYENSWLWDEEEDYLKTIEILVSQQEANDIMLITPNELYEHLKQSVGVMTSKRGKNYMIPRYTVGRFELSLQLGYNLWSLREDKDNPHESPMTQEEFDKILPSTNSFLDVHVGFRQDNGDIISVIQACQISLVMVCEELHELINSRTLRSDLYR